MTQQKRSSSRKQKADITRSSAAEYLSFVAGSGDGGVEAVYADESVWLSQKMMAVLYDVEIPTINYHLKKVYADSELDRSSTIRDFLRVQQEGSRKVSRSVEHYNLKAIIAVGYKVNSERAVQFRKWATEVVSEFTIKAWVMDAERLKSGSVLTKEYFEQQLQRIREIRASERMFYQKITDLYATALDYDATAEATRRFFASVQNRLHFAIHGHTAAELIVDRADASKPHMGLTTWKDAPDGKIQKFDISVGKNYLSESELEQLERMVSAYLDFAESMTLRNVPLTMADWEVRLGKFIELFDGDVLQDAGAVSAEVAKLYAETEFEKYRIIQDQLFVSDFDRFLTLERATEALNSDVEGADK